MTLFQAHRARRMTLSGLAADVSWGLMVLQRKGRGHQSLERIRSGVVLCEVLEAAARKEVGKGDDAASELQSNLVVGLERQTAGDVDVQAVIQSVGGLVAPFREALDDLAKGHVGKRTDKDLNDMREMFGQLAVRLQDLGI